MTKIHHVSKMGSRSLRARFSIQKDVLSSDIVKSLCDGLFNLLYRGAAETTAKFQSGLAFPNICLTAFDASYEIFR